MQKISSSTLIPMGLSATAIGIAFGLGIWKGQLDRRMETLEAAAPQLAYVQSQIMILRQDVEVIKAGMNESNRPTSNETTRRRNP